MRFIGKEKFLKFKKTDTLVIWGSGSSINNLTNKDMLYLNNFDSIGFNSSVEIKINTTYYIVGEILFNYYRINEKNKIKYEENNPANYINKLSKSPLSCFIIWDDDKTLNANHYEELNKLSNDYILVKQYGHEPNLDKFKLDKGNNFVNKELYNEKLLLEDKILLHQHKGINAPIYFAKCMNYKNIIFVGVDLTFGKKCYASKSREKFFDEWISKVHRHDKNNLTSHPSKEYLFKFIEYLKDDINFSTYTPSLLEEIIDIHTPF